MAGWSIDIGKIAQKMGATVDQTARAITLEAFTSVIENTRVDTGRAKGNWQTTTGQPALGTIDRLDPNGTAAISEAASNIKPASLNIISNNLPYIEKLEELDGMVGRTDARLDRIIREKINAAS